MVDAGNSTAKPSWAYPTRPSEEALKQFFSEEAQAFVPSDTDIFITNSKGAQ